MPKTKLNIVEIIDFDDDEAFDQPCIHGNRVGGHSVYCHHPADIARKCVYRWCSQKEHEENDCGGYEPNPNYDGQNEQKS